MRPTGRTPTNRPLSDLPAVPVTSETRMRLEAAGISASGLGEAAALRKLAESGGDNPADRPDCFTQYGHAPVLCAGCVFAAPCGIAAAVPAPPPGPRRG